MIGKYPITKIDILPGSFANQGFQIWYWHVGGSSLDCPLEPLTPEFWQEKRRARLVHGLLLPAVDVRDRGDLLILVTQRLQHVNRKEFGGLTIRQRYELYALILDIDFTHVEGLKIMPTPIRIDFFKKFEKIFDEQILPKKDEKGEYHRELSSSPENEILRPDQQGNIKCPKCEQLVGIGKGLLVMDSYYVNDGTILVFATCEHCEEFVAVNIDAPPGHGGPKAP
jgi:hypothetical protein